MGAGGRMTEKEREKQEQLARATGGAAMQRSPVEKPPFTVGQIKKAIPPHCFERSVLKSFSYVVHDLVIATALLYFALAIIPALPSPLHYVAWPLYWIAQGCVCTGVWVIAHECGHHAFSDYQLLDDIVGLVLHSSLMVPYFSWKYSHRRHHSNTGSLERDEVFVPKKKEALPWYTPYVYNNPVGRLVHIVVQLTLGWPLYLATNASGRPYPRFACHFDPYGPIYNDRERAQIFISDAGVMAVSFGLYKLAATFGFWWVVRVYAVPLLIVNAWLVLITYLQHTHPALPHYDSSEWDWLRGALATMDRDYGILNRVFHNITDTHVAHHLFSTMPHYHAMEVLALYTQSSPTLHHRVGRSCARAPHKAGGPFLPKARTDGRGKLPLIRRSRPPCLGEVVLNLRCSHPTPHRVRPGPRTSHKALIPVVSTLHSVQPNTPPQGRAFMRSRPL